MSKTRTVHLPPKSEIERLIKAAVHEDLGSGDITTRSTLPRPIAACGLIRAREEGVMAGGTIAAMVFKTVDRRLKPKALIRDGAAIHPGQTIFSVRGDARSILAGERVALNFLQQLCGIASYSARVVDELRGTRAILLATRKTTPGLRSIQKYAVQLGGGYPHRQGLYDEILIKENHLDMARMDPAMLAKKVRAAVGPRIPITAEARNFREAARWIEGGVDRVLLDNMTPSKLKKVLPQLRSLAKSRKRKVEFEASGGIHLDNARDYAKAGVDRISLGALTHSVHALDLGLDILPLEK